jgi:cardiolipin synthase
MAERSWLQIALSQIPNAISVGRIILVLPTAWCLWIGQYVDALILMAIAGASDAVDGWLARRFEWDSQLGAAIDPLADKFLVGVLFLVFAIQGQLPVWVVAVVVGRDLVIMIGAISYRLLFRSIEFHPTLISKANTAMQISIVLLILLGLCEFPVISDLAKSIAQPYGVWLLAILGVVSGLDYVITWSRKAIADSKLEA